MMGIAVQLRPPFALLVIGSGNTRDYPIRLVSPVGPYNIL